MEYKLLILPTLMLFRIFLELDNDRKEQDIRNSK